MDLKVKEESGIKREKRQNLPMEQHMGLQNLCRRVMTFAQFYAFSFKTVGLLLQESVGISDISEFLYSGEYENGEQHGNLSIPATSMALQTHSGTSPSGNCNMKGMNWI